MSLHLGTSGWAYPEWRPAFYPRDLPRARYLEHYASRLTACEINATFYQLQSPETLAGWAAGVPEGFRFAAKAHRAVTHTAAGAASAARKGGMLGRFLESMTALGDRLGAILVQFPPTREREDAMLAVLLDALRSAPPFAIEFRHESWFTPEVVGRVAGAGGTVCLADTTGEVPERLPPGPLAYVRLRADSYTEQTRAGWRDLLVREARRRPVYAFAKHKNVPAGDPFTGVGLAEWLVQGVNGRG